MKIKIKKIVILFLLLAIFSLLGLTVNVFVDASNATSGSYGTSPVTASGDEDYIERNKCLETYYYLNQYLEGKSDRKHNDQYAEPKKSYYRNEEKGDIKDAYDEKISNESQVSDFDSRNNIIKRTFSKPYTMLAESYGVKTEVYKTVIDSDGKQLGSTVVVEEDEQIALEVGQKLQLKVLVKFNWFNYKVDYLTAVKNGNTTVVALFPYKPEDSEVNGWDDCRFFEYIATKDTNNKSVAVGFEAYTHANYDLTITGDAAKPYCRNFFKVQVEVQENAYQDIKKFIAGDERKKQHLMNEISSNGIYNTIVTDNKNSADKNSKILKKSHPVLYKLSLIDGGRDILYQWYYKCRINAENFLYMSTDEINEYISKKGNLSKDDKIELNKKKHAKTSYDVINILLNRRARKRNKFRS